MLSPSLTSALVHAIWSDNGLDRAPGQFSSDKDVVDDTWDILRMFGEANKPMPSVPMLGWTKHARAFPPLLTKQLERFEARTTDGGEFVIGRVDVDLLFQRLTDSHVLPFDEEYLDLGTPLEPSHSAGGGVVNSIANLLGTPRNQPSTQIAMIDLADASPGSSPPDFNRLNHLYLQDREFSPHAMRVLLTLLTRLQGGQNLLQDAELYCGLIVAPNKISRRCFRSANAVEMQLALLELRRRASTHLPLFVNASLGTHVGPHNGISPLEKATAALMPYNDGRVVVCAAGNDGGSGVAARRELRPNSPDYLRFKTSSAGTKDLLIEFWWEEPQTSTMELNVAIKHANGQPVCQPLLIQPRSAGANVATRFSGGGTVNCLSLYYGRCSATMCCVAFAISTPNSDELADLTIDFGLTCQTRTVVNAWRVLPSHDASSFVTGVSECSITVPATASSVVSVAGVEKDGSSWIESSRGPTADYVFGGSGTPTAPMMAHLVQYTGRERGTSYASPRATADLAAQVDAHGFPASPLDLVRQELNVAPNASWDPRIGYGAITN